MIVPQTILIFKFLLVKLSLVYNSLWVVQEELCSSMTVPPLKLTSAAKGLLSDYSSLH